LLARADLPRHAGEAAVLMIRVLALRAERAAASRERVRTGDDARARAVRDVGAADRLVDGEQPDRSEVPNLILLDRTADGRVGVVVLADLVDRLHTQFLEVIRQVVGLERSAFVPDEERPAETVAAFFRDHVDLDAAG